MQNEKIKKIITVIACIVVQICVGILYLWSIFSGHVVEYYDFSEKSATMVAPIMLMGFVLGNLIGGYLQDKTNPRLIATIGAASFSLGIFITSFLTKNTVNLIFLSYCTIGGLGCGFTYASILSCLQKWFPKKRGFASGIAVASFAASTVIFGPISQTLLTLSAFKDKNVPYTFLTLSLVFFAFSMVACLFIRLPKTQESLCKSEPSSTELNSFDFEKNINLIANSDGNSNGSEQLNNKNKIIDYNKNEKRNYTPLQAMKTIPFWCITLTLFFINGTWNMALPLIKGLALERNLSEVAAIATVTITGITNTFGRFSMATVSDKIGRTFTILLLALTTMVCALLLIWATGYFYLAIIALLAFCYGGPSSTLPAMTTDLYGTKYGGTNYGIAMLGLGISSVVFNAISIYLANLTFTFIMGAITAAIAALLMILSHFLIKNRKMTQNKNNL